MRWTSRRIVILRRHLGESQPVFAARLGVSVKALRDWEQPKRNKPAPLVVMRQLTLLQWVIEHCDLLPEHPDPVHRPRMPGAEKTREEE